MWKKLFLFTVIIWIVSPIQSAVLECNWGQQMEICYVKNITPVTQQNEVITINGEPSNYVNTYTRGVYFTNQTVNYMPTGIFMLFPNLETLVLEKCETKLLTTDSLPNCGQLTILTVRGGTFTLIPAGVFQSCKSVNWLGIGENNVTTVDVDAFRGLGNLTTLYSPSSKISCLPLGLFRHTPLLKYIYLYNNLITAVDSNLFTNLPNLGILYLSYNLLSYIPVLNLTGTATNNQSSLSIGLDSNPIYAFAPDFCSTFGSRPVDNLKIYFLNISCIPDNSGSTPGYISSSNCQNYSTQLQNCYANWTSSMNAPVTCGVQPPTTPSPTLGSCPSDKICRYFLDQYNRYTCILDGVDSVLTSISGNHLITFADVNVRRVIFTNSFLSRIPSILFQKFTSLEYLTVSNCSMSAINTNTFTACGNLKYFDASNNLITTVDGASFKSCAALEVIDLTGNKFDMISGQLFVNNPNLKAVYINRPPAMVLI